MSFCSNCVSFVFIFGIYLSQLSTFLSPGCGLVLASSSPIGNIDINPSSESNDNAEFEELLKAAQELERKHNAKGETLEKSSISEDDVKTMIQSGMKDVVNRVIALEASSDGKSQDSGTDSSSSEGISKITAAVENVEEAASEIESGLEDGEERLEDLEKKTQVKCNYSPTVPNGRIEYMDVKEGSQATVTCNTNFGFCGKKSHVKCSEGQWSEYDGRCIKNVWTNLVSDTEMELACGIRVGTVITLQGTPTRFHSFNVNLLDKNSINVLHIAVRFYAYNVYKGFLMNSKRTSGSWDRQIIVRKDFNFQVNQKFTMVITVKKDQFEIAVQQERSSKVVKYFFPHRHDISVVTSMVAYNYAKYSKIEYKF